MSIKTNIAERLWEAGASGKPIEPISEEVGVEDITLAYQIQNLNTKRRIENGSKIIGKKIGLTSEAIQRQVGVEQPDFGVLFHDMEVLNGLSVSTKKLMQPKVEAEIAFVLSHDLDHSTITTIDVINAIDYAIPAIEILGSRIADWNIKITDTVADNASASHFVIGHTPLSLSEFDMINAQMTMKINNTVVSEGTGAACLGSPINAVLWLAKKMVEVGTPLREGELILSGALGPMIPVNPDDYVEVEISTLGGASVHFTS
ncbi:2-keto-4-pentenoate hydratase [Ekhidna sp.]|jgi:2-keto-4-pentenoate hydratase|uniref:2-keto-4-pentenoate hydratase n=1 Tax=Ekhidna sp. TaxID=2608089 RepID=UPI0032EF9578